MELRNALLNLLFQNETCLMWQQMVNTVAVLMVWIAMLVMATANMVPERRLKCVGKWCKKFRFTFTEEEPNFLDEVNPYSLAYTSTAFSIMVIVMATCGKRAIFIWQSLKFPGMTKKQIARNQAKLRKRKGRNLRRFTDMMQHARKVAFTPMPAMPWLESNSVEYTTTEEQKSRRTTKQPSVHGPEHIEEQMPPEHIGQEEALEVQAEAPLVEEVE